MDQLLALRTFVRIVEAGSLANAARSLSSPRSSVSKLLQDLERHLGVQLVSRSTRATTITDEGNAYYQRAIRLLSELDEMDAEAAGVAALPSGRLRVDIGSSLANLVLIPALPSFISLYPEIEITLGVSDRAVDLISEGVDCVIRGGALSDSSLISRKIAELEYVTCASASYVEAHGAPSDLVELERDHRTIAYFSASTGMTFPLRFRDGPTTIELHSRATAAVNESTAHLTGILAGLGVGQTFRFVANPYLERRQLVELLPSMQSAPLPLHLVYPQDRRRGAKLRVFADWVSDLFAVITKPQG